MLKYLPNAKSSAELHCLTYSSMRKSCFIPSDVVQEARKDVRAKRKTIKNGFKWCFVRLNKRWFRFFERGTPCFKITYSPYESFVIPVKRDGGYKRFKDFLEGGWEIKAVSLLDSKIALSIEREFLEPVNERGYVIGVDIGSSTLAAVTVFDPRTEVVKQLYFGRDAAVRQRKFEGGRSKLKSYAGKGSEKAKRHFKKLHKQGNFKTRSGQIAKEIVNLALKYSASVVIEKLSIIARNGKVNKNKGKKINRSPFAQFKDFLKSNRFKHSILFQEVDAYHTSKWFPKRGALNKEHSPNYVIYKCKCGFVANSNRIASLATAIKSALAREYSQGLTNPSRSQLTRAGVPAKGLFRPGEGGSSGAVHLTQPLMEIPARKSGIVSKWKT